MEKIRYDSWPTNLIVDKYNEYVVLLIIQSTGLGVVIFYTIIV